MATYCIDLWDDEVGKDGAWSRELAEQFLGQGKASGLSARDTVRALRKLRSWHWSSVSIYVEREN